MTLPRRDFLTGALTLTLACVALPDDMENKSEMQEPAIYDCLIVGGGIAGLSAALALGRARRKVLLCSGGPPRNAPAPHSHNFVTRVGVPPLELLTIARSQLAPYESVSLRDVQVRKITRSGDAEFEARLSEGKEVRSRTVILATGMRDELDGLPGLNELWGDSVFACPFCHGWEYRDRRWALMTDRSSALDKVKLARSWTPNLLVCSRDGISLEEEQASALDALGISFYSSPVVRLEGEKTLQAIVLADGERVPCDAMLYRPPQKQRSTVAEELGCAFEPNGFIQTQAPFGATSVPGVFAIGDVVGPMQSLITASASGSFAGAGVHHLLMQVDFERDLHMAGRK